MYGSISFCSNVIFDACHISGTLLFCFLSLKVLCKFIYVFLCVFIGSQDISVYMDLLFRTARCVDLFWINMTMYLDYAFHIEIVPVIETPLRDGRQGSIHFYSQHNGCL